ncbi:MAG TPA: hypothetical protein DEP20_01360 [Fusobacteria bacterium]|nr:hypothetical protein [Fusobacteriota bacterium]|tara:strand:+ start:5262 stop:5603 length:342 start_codon:yes stop_codon:yes gene_type:complete
MNTLKIRRNMENLLYKSAVDIEFRNRCLKEGKSVLEEELGTKLDSDIKVQFKESGDEKDEIKLEGRDLMFLLPEFVGTINKLERKDLERITGGVSEYMDKNNESINNLINLII